jgi:hypothetical protein
LDEAKPQAEREVWDILDAGPRNSFTCEGLLVHNSGNIQRFFRDFTEVYFDGFTSLDMSEKLDKTVRKDEGDYEPSGCPSCGHKPFHRRCMACGHEKESIALVGEAAGEMREIRIGKKVIASDAHDLWRQLCGYVHAHGKQPGYAWHTYKRIVGKEPPRSWTFETTDPAPLTRGTLNKIKSLRIAYFKAKEKGAASA